MTVIDSFEALPLAAPLHRALRDKQYTTPSPIQAQAIPHLLEGRDLLGSAQTGTGKTAAYALPILQHLQADGGRRARSKQFRALVLTPTRELAVQVAESFCSYGKHLDLDCALVYGGVAQGPQVRALRKGLDVLVATPGRLLDLYNQGHINFSGVEHFVLDEADRMLDMGFLPDIRKVVAELPEARQSLFFSATLSDSIIQLAGTILHEPVEVRIAPEAQTADRVDHRVCFLQHENKMPLLETLLKAQGEEKSQGLNLSLVFSRTKHGADKMVKILKRAGIKADSIHGNKSQNARQRALQNFRSGQTPVLVATDVAARGIDVKQVTLVVNYDLPDEAEAYVHRIGRTARAGAEGVAVSFCTAQNFSELRAVERLLGEPIELLKEQPFHHENTAAKRPGKGGGHSKRSGGGDRGRSRGKRQGFSGPQRRGKNQRRRPAGKMARS